MKKLAIVIMIISFVCLYLTGGAQNVFLTGQFNGTVEHLNVNSVLIASAEFTETSNTEISAVNTLITQSYSQSIVTIKGYFHCIAIQQSIQKIVIDSLTIYSYPLGNVLKEIPKNTYYIQHKQIHKN